MNVPGQTGKKKKRKKISRRQQKLSGFSYGSTLKLELGMCVRDLLDEM